MDNMEIIKFSAEWCGPCRVYKPVFDKWADTLTDIDVKSVDVEKDNEMAVKYGVRSIPLTVAVNGDKVHRLEGRKSKKELDDWLSNIM
jgi:thioredoxin 1